MRRLSSFVRTAIVAAALCLPAGAAMALPQAEASSVEVTGTGASARFTLELSRDVDFNVFALADPYRVIIDLPEVDFQLPADAGQDGNGLIRAFRFGLFSAGKSRIVLDVAAPVSIVEPYILPASGGQPARLEIGLRKTTRDAFMRDYALNGGRPPAETASEPPPASIADLISPRADRERPVIVIDPGHGGIDPGTRSDADVLEKDIVLAFGRRLRDSLQASGKFDVLMTRDSDTFVPLRDRREFARVHQADLFISIHADSVRQGEVRGATVYTLSDKASDEVAEALATKENKADLIAGVALDDVSTEVSDILVELAQRETNNLSQDFASTLVRALRNRVRLNHRPQRSAAFVVLKAHDVPSVLVELGYLSNSRDAESLESAKWRETAAGAVSRAVDGYFGTRLAKRR